MRYLRWIIVLLFGFFLIIELIYNLPSTTQTFQFKIWFPGKILATLELEIWMALLITFALGFGLAIIFELYYWGKYTLNFRRQNKIIEELRKRLEFFKPKEQASVNNTNKNENEKK